MTATGPWRVDKESAVEDGEALRRAYLSGGSQALTELKNGLYTAAGAAPPPSRKDNPADVAAAAAAGGGTAAGGVPWEVEVNKSTGTFRAICRFQKQVFYDRGGRAMTINGPWRNTRDLAERDALAMCDQYETGGLSAVQALKNDMFKNAFSKTTASASSRSGSAAGSGGGGGEDRPRGAEDRPRPERSRSRDASASPSPSRTLAAAAQAATGVWGDAAAAGESPGGGGRGSSGSSGECRVEMEHSDRGHRAICHLPPDENSSGFGSRTGVSLTLPWRQSRREARADGDAVVAAYSEGGAAGAHARKNEFFTGRLAGSAAAAAPSNSSTDSSQPKDDRVEAVRSGFRAVCRFTTDADTSGGFRKSAGSLAISGPNRSSVAQAQSDADFLEREFKDGGMPAVHKARNDLFRGAFKEKPEPSGEVESEKAEDGPTSRSEVEADRGDRGRGYRAHCHFVVAGVDHGPGLHFNKNTTPISLIGPWRTSRSDAEADEAALNEAFRAGGMEAAQNLKHELRRGVLARGEGVPQAAMAVDKLSQEEMVGTYGKGFLLAQKMGYGGSGLGRQEQGRELLVSLDGARAAVGSAARLGLGSGPGGGRASEGAQQQAKHRSDDACDGDSPGGLGLGAGADDHRPGLGSSSGAVASAAPAGGAIAFERGSAS